MRRALSTIAAALLTGGALLATTSGAASTVKPSATALVASGYVGTQGAAHASGTAEHRGGAPIATGALTVGEAATTARTSAGAGTAHASAVARGVSLLDGRVTADAVRRTADATKDGVSYSGSVQGLAIDGHTIGSGTAAHKYDLDGGDGRVIVNRGGTGLRLVTSNAVSGLPAGSEIRVAIANAGVTVTAAPTPTPTATPSPAPTPKPKPKPTATPTPKKHKKLSSGKARTTGLKRKQAPQVPKRLTESGFAFPVYGDATVADNFGAARAAPIVSHEGDDIFAAFGSPVVAVADGTVSRVGTLPISGNRLWVTTASGDAFFYAHLSAFSPAAVDGAKVKAGTVLGFVGNTGDAEPTPPHLHFEVHPGGEPEPAVDPYKILTSWQGRRDVAPGAWLQHNGADTTERPGALVAVKDFIAQ